MYKEIVKREGNTVLMIIGLIVLVFTCMSILDSIPIQKYEIVVDLVSVCLVTFVAFVVLMRKVVDYKYMLIDSDLIFYRILGSRETAVLNVNLGDIKIIAPVGSEQLKKWRKADKKYNLSTSILGRNQYCGVFCKNGKTCKFLFQPSEKLIKLLSRDISDKIFEK